MTDLWVSRPLESPHTSYGYIGVILRSADCCVAHQVLRLQHDLKGINSEIFDCADELMRRDMVY